MTTALDAARRRQEADLARLSSFMPLAVDPELAEHALWNDELAADAEEAAVLAEAEAERLKRQGFETCRCGLVAMRRGFHCPCENAAIDARNRAEDSGKRFADRFTVIPDSGTTELECSQCRGGDGADRWQVGYHPSLDVLIEQALAHNRAVHGEGTL